MILELVLLLLPLIIGYVISPLPRKVEYVLNRILGLEIYVILVLMGASLTSIPDWIEHLKQLWWQTLLLAGLLLVFNLLGLWLMIKMPRRSSTTCLAAANTSATSSSTTSVSVAGSAAADPLTMDASITRSFSAGTTTDSKVVPNTSTSPGESLDTTLATESSGVASALRSALLPIVLVVLGIVLGVICPPLSQAASFLVTLLIYLLLLLIGHQLRDTEVSLKQLIMNRLGIKMTFAVILSSALAGVCTMPFLHTSLAASLALSSGFGWYSLSSVMLNNLLGPYYGGLALCNDLVREMIAITLLPFLFTRGAPIAIGYCGATAMDVTLPLIQKQGGNSVVPLALCSGFLLSLASPILMVILATFAR